jgi:hypothetical protein
MAKDPNGPAGYQALFGETYKRMFAVVKEMSDHELAKQLPKNVYLTAIACAAVRAAAVAITPIRMPLSEVKHFSKNLIDEVKRYRDKIGAKGKGIMDQ